MNLRTELKIALLEPQRNGLTLIDALASDGTRVMIEVRVVEPLAVGDVLHFSLRAEPAGAQPARSAASLRDRMLGRTPGTTGTSAAEPPRSAVSTSPPASSSAASSLLLSSILGARSDNASASDLTDNTPLVERNVDDEMDALFGAPRKG